MADKMQKREDIVTYVKALTHFLESNDIDHGLNMVQILFTNDDGEPPEIMELLVPTLLPQHLFGILISLISDLYSHFGEKVNTVGLELKCPYHGRVPDTRFIVVGDEGFCLRCLTFDQKPALWVETKGEEQ